MWIGGFWWTVTPELAHSASFFVLPAIKRVVVVVAVVVVLLLSQLLLHRYGLRGRLDVRGKKKKKTRKLTPVWTLQSSSCLFISPFVLL